MTRKSRKRVAKPKDLRARGIKNDARAKREGSQVRGGASKLAKGLQSSPSQTKVVVS
jgi:hypothetical protein